MRASRHPDHCLAVRHGARDDSAGANYGLSADFNIGQDHRSGADLDSLTDGDPSREHHAGVDDREVTNNGVVLDYRAGVHEDAAADLQRPDR